IPEGGVIDALVAVVIASSLAGMRDSPTIVIGAPPAAAARNVGVRAPPPLMKAELELRKAICACAALPSVMPASAPISSTARTSPRCRRDSACLRVVRVTFIVISSCSHALPALACKKILSWPVIDVQSRAGGPLRSTSGLRRRNSSSTARTACRIALSARATRYCRGRVLALAQNGRYLARDIARCWSPGIGTARACRLIARVDNQLIYPDAAVALGRAASAVRRVGGGQSAAHGDRERRQRAGEPRQVGGAAGARAD